MTVQKKWYHATTKEAWKQIKRECVLWGIDDPRQTFLARNLDELIRMINLPLMGDLRKCELILTVKYEPNGIDDNYNTKSWEMVVNKPISIDNVKLLRFLT